MKLKVTKQIDVDALIMNVCANVRYTEDAEINCNGEWVEDDAENPKMPCLIKKNGGWDWKPVISLDTGKILNWRAGVEAKLYYKVCDEFSCSIVNNDEILREYEGYVPDCFGIVEENYGDYIYIDIDETGHIKNWKFTQDDFDSLENSL